jgi:RHS repeat-associated protein
MGTWSPRIYGESGSTPTVFYCYDGNETATKCVHMGGTGATAYVYDSCSSTIFKSGTPADSDPFRLATTYTYDKAGLSYYGLRFYNPPLGRWLSRDPIGDAGGINQYGFVKNRPVSRFDVLGLTYYEEPIENMTLAALRDRFGHGFLAQTPWAEPWTPVVAIHWVQEYNGGCCAEVKSAKPINVTVRTFVPTYVVGEVFTAQGYQAMLGHEGRRRQAYRNGYDAYLAPVSEKGSQAVKCGKICRSESGAAKKALEQYLDDIQEDALNRYETYELQEQAAISFEDMESNVIPMNDLIHGYRSTHAVRDAGNPTDLPCP